MSGLAVVAHSDGQPADRALLDAMALALRKRGPEEQCIWSDGGPIGLVHTRFQTTTDTTPSQQPCSFDGANWIVADARLDARRELIERLKNSGRHVEQTTGDAELILHAWHSWGTACLRHLLGDFSFAIVNTSQRRVFAARDPLGVKPLFYAHVHEHLILSNLLEAVRLCPPVNDQLNDSWVCDFLLFGWNSDPTSTVFQTIRRLPAGHWLEWTPSGLRVHPYWSPPTPEMLRLRRAEEYVERFTAVFETAVADRVRCERLTVAMSGGLDSTSIMAAVLDWSRRRAPTTQVRSLTAVWDPVLSNDREREFATAAAEFLEIPTQFIEGSTLPYFDGVWDTPETQMPEPVERANLMPYTIARAAAGHGRILLYGECGDEAQRFPATHFRQLLARGKYLHWLADMWRHWHCIGRLPAMGLRTAMRSLTRSPPPATPAYAPDFPPWIAKDLVREFDLENRWRQFWRLEKGATTDSPHGSAAVANYLIADMLNFHDANGMHGPVEYRFPWLDLRVLQFFWSLPPVPYCVNKYLVRLAMRGRLPRPVVERRKAGLAGDPFVTRRDKLSLTWSQCVARAPALTRYVQTDPLASIRDKTARSPNVWLGLRPLELYSWLHHRAPTRKVGKCPTTAGRGSPPMG